MEILDNPPREELRAKLEMKTINVEDKVMVLNARDLLLKMSGVSIKSKDGHFIGTCPDMCPEKERYYRKMINEIKPYEVDEEDPDSLNLCIKKYSRSAADKDVVSHELRPPKVLQFTMNHILNCIIPRGEENPENLPSWYDFVWDRTRAIRTDISVQCLYDDVAVSIVEKIARFHIHCAFRLGHFDASQFDQKLNSDNMTKSIRTLRDMYRKRRERGLESPNEAEFHAYHLLLKLGDHVGFNSGLTDCKRFLESRPIKFAVEIWRSLRMFNYMKFFRLVRYEATYLQAALLQRYFTSVRWRTLKMIQKTTRARPLTYPVDDFRDNLCFDEEELEEFLVCAGTGVEDDSIILSEVAEALEAPPSPCMSSVISYKMTDNVAQIINGGPLDVDNCRDHIPHNSFDSQGYLKHESKRALDQGLRPEQLKMSAGKSEGEASDSSDEEQPYKIRKRPNLSVPTSRTSSPMRDRLGPRRPVEVKVPGLIKEAPPLRKTQGKLTVADFAALSAAKEKKAAVAPAPAVQLTPLQPLAITTTTPSLPITTSSLGRPTLTQQPAPPSIFQAWKPAAPQPIAELKPAIPPLLIKPTPTFSVAPQMIPPQFVKAPPPAVDSKESTDVEEEEIEEIVEEEEEEEVEVEETLSKEMEELLDMLYDSVPVVANSLIDETISKLVRGVAYQFCQSVVEPIRTVAPNIQNQILFEVVTEELEEIGANQIKIETDRVVERNRAHLLAFRSVLRWRSFARRKRKRRISMENFPAYASFLPLEDQLKRIANRKSGVTPDKILEIQKRTDDTLAKVCVMNDIERRVKRSGLDVPLVIGEELLRQRDELLRNSALRNFLLIKSEISFKLSVICLGKSAGLFEAYLRSKFFENFRKPERTNGMYTLSSKVDPHHRVTVSIELRQATNVYQVDDLEPFDGILVAVDDEIRHEIERSFEGLNVAFLTPYGEKDAENVFVSSFEEKDVPALLEVQRSLQFLASQSALKHSDIIRPYLSESDALCITQEEIPVSLEQSILAGAIVCPTPARTPRTPKARPRKRMQSELSFDLDFDNAEEPPEHRAKIEVLKSEFYSNVADVVASIRSEERKAKEFEDFLRILLGEVEE